MNWKFALTIFTIDVFLMSSSYTLMIPFLPVYLLNELGATSENVNLWSGAVFAIAFIMSGSLAPIWGRLADRYGKKTMMIRASVLLTLSYFFCFIVQTPFQLFLARAFQGFASGLWPTVLAILSAYSPKEKIGLCMGVIQSSNISGTIIGPLLGGFIAQNFGVRESFLLTTILLAIISVINIVFVKEPPKSECAIENSDYIATTVRNRDLLKDRAILCVLIATSSFAAIIMLMVPVVTIFVEELEPMGSNNILLSGFVFSLSGIAGVIASPVWGVYGQKRGFFKVLIIAMATAGVAMSTQALSQSLWMFASLQFIAGLCFCGIMPSLNSMLIDITAYKDRGKAFGLLYGFQQLGNGIGPLLGGLVATLIATRFVFLTAGIIFFLMIAFLLHFAPMKLRLNKPKECKEQS